jgi:tRNA A37 threonylcarbamoyladenosine biosynthesis protein TsaE
MEQKVHQLWIEWADQFKQVLPVWDLKIQFLHLGEEKRGLVLQTPVDSPLILDEIKS